MEDALESILYVIIAVVILVFNVIRKNKAAERLNQGVSNSLVDDERSEYKEDFFLEREREGDVQQEDHSKDEIERIVNVERDIIEEEWIDVFQNGEGEECESGDGFGLTHDDLEQAVLYSEVLNRKY